MKKYLMAIVAVASAQASYAADIQCNGSVTGLLIYQNGIVNLATTYRSGYTNICNLKSTRKGVDPLTCAMWISVIESARKQNQNIHVYYKDDGTFSSCATIPWNNDSPGPWYIGH